MELSDVTITRVEDWSGELTGIRTTLTEDRQGIALLKRALHEAYEVGVVDLSENDAYDEAKLWDELLAVLGVST